MIRIFIADDHPIVRQGVRQIVALHDDLVVAGGHYVTVGLAERLAANISGGGAMPHESLTDREYQVFRLMAAGQSSRQIARALSLSIKTVSTHRAYIFQKMQMTSAAQLAAYAVRNRIAD